MWHILGRTSQILKCYSTGLRALNFRISWGLKFVYLKLLITDNMANTRPHCGSSETSEAAGHPWQSSSVVTLLPGVNERPMNSLTETEGLSPCHTNRRQWDNHRWHQKHKQVSITALHVMSSQHSVSDNPQTRQLSPPDQIYFRCHRDSRHVTME